MGVDPAQMLHKTALGLLDRFMCGCSSTSFQVYDDSAEYNPEKHKKTSSFTSQDQNVDDHSLLAAARSASMSFGYEPTGEPTTLMSAPQSHHHHHRRQNSHSSNSPHQQHGFIFLDGSRQAPPSHSDQLVFRSLERNRSTQTATTASVSSGTSSTANNSQQQHHAIPPIPAIQSSQTFDEDEEDICDHDDDDDDTATTFTCATPTHSNVSTVHTSNSSPYHDYARDPSLPSLRTLRAAKQRAREHRDAAWRGGGPRLSREILPELAELHKTEGYRC